MMAKPAFLWCFMLFTALILSRYSILHADDAFVRDCLDSFNTGGLPRYAAGKLDEIKRMIASFPRKEISAKNEEQSLYELIRIVKTTQSSYHASQLLCFWLE